MPPLPVGRWSLAQGTFSVMMDEVWEFRPDGTGSITYISVLSGTDREPFRWRPVGPFCLELCCWPDEPPEDWVRVEYELAEVQHDAGTETALRQIGSEGFFTSPAPLRWLGPC